MLGDVAGVQLRSAVDVGAVALNDDRELHDSFGSPALLRSIPLAVSGASARSEPDGYKLYLATDGPLTVAASLYKRVPYD